MLEIHSRAARVPNSPVESWLQFALGSFSGQTAPRGPAVTLEVREAAHPSEMEAVLQGLLQFAQGEALPVVQEFQGWLNLQTRDLSLHAGQQHFTGRYSENGRVLTLTATESTGRPSKPMQLVHEGTRQELTGS